MITQLLEPLILGQRIQILDNDPMSELLRRVMCVFRIDRSKFSALSFSDYFSDVELVESPSSNGIVIDTQNTKIQGNYEKNKFLKNIIEKDITKQKSLQGRIKIINTTIDTIASATLIILSNEDKFSIEKGNIQNILQSLGFEEARLVLELIKNYPSCRDCDNKLVANVWNKQLELKGIDIKTLSATDLLKMFADGKLHNPTSLRRERAKYQEVNPHLRGFKYKERQTKKQESFKKKMREKGLYDDINNNFEQENID